MKQGLLANEVRAWLLRPTVVHRLPGRLRLRVPALTRLDDGQRICASFWRDLLAAPAEIEAVEVNVRTGSVLIRYRTAVLGEYELLAFIRSVNRLVLRHWDRLAAVRPDALPEVLERLLEVVRGAVRHRLVLDERIEVPQDVWAEA